MRTHKASGSSWYDGDILRLGKLLKFHSKQCESEIEDVNVDYQQMYKTVTLMAKIKKFFMFVQMIKLKRIKL